MSVRSTLIAFIPVVGAAIVIGGAALIDWLAARYEWFAEWADAGDA